MLYTKNPKAVVAGRLGGMATARAHPGKEYVRAGHAAFMRSFVRLADPNGLLPEDERQERAAELCRAHFQLLRRRGLAVRRRNAAASKTTAAGERS